MLRPILLTVSALLPAAALALPADRPVDSAAARLAGAARAFLAALDEDDRAQATFAFDDAERTNWNFLPGTYPGVPLAELDLGQRRAAHGLLGAALSSQGTLKTTAVVRLEQVLRDAAEAAGRTAEVAMRDPERHALAVFGDPTDDGTWGFRFQGHHVSLNFTVIAGREITSTPRFLGANPHELRQGPFAGTRVLGAEEDRARQLLDSLDPDQRARAILGDDVPADILVAPGRTADLLGPPRGIAWTDLRPDQQALMTGLLECYAHDLAAPIARQERRRAGAGLHFAWIGSTEPGRPHYYRIHGADLVVEYDNIQNGANHSHTVWHDLRNGFGGDLLRAHHEAAHDRE